MFNNGTDQRVGHLVKGKASSYRLYEQSQGKWNEDHGVSLGFYHILKIHNSQGPSMAAMAENHTLRSFVR
jgi:hypothetical protein